MVAVHDVPAVGSDTALWLKQMGCLPAIIGQDLNEHCQLTLDAYRVLMLIAERPQIQKVLAYDMCRPFALVSRCVTMLSHLGLAVRRIPPKAGIPGCEVSITRRGRNQLRRTLGYRIERYCILGDGLTDSHLLLLERVEENMRRFVRKSVDWPARNSPTYRSTLIELSATATYFWLLQR